MSDSQNQMLGVYLQEYNQLKSEQTARIGFRDNLLYVTLAAQGAIFSFTLINHSSKSIGYYPFLVIPLVCLILGWAYLINDDKISEIGRYIRYELSEKIIYYNEFQLEQGLEEKIKQNIETLDNRDSNIIDILPIFGWEVFHRSDKRRRRRKREQFFIDLITFVISGIASLLAFWCFVSQPHWIILSLSIIEFFLLIILAVEIFIYADLDFGR